MNTLKKSALTLLLVLCGVAVTLAQSPTVTTDKEDYQPGDIVVITGTGWLPDGEVSLRIVADCGCTDVTLTATADEEGNFSNEEFEIEETHLGVTFTLTASGYDINGKPAEAQTTFTDAVTRLASSLTVDGNNVVTVSVTLGVTSPNVVQRVCARLAFGNFISAPAGGVGPVCEIWLPLTYQGSTPASGNGVWSTSFQGECGQQYRYPRVQWYSTTGSCDGTGNNLTTNHNFTLPSCTGPCITGPSTACAGSTNNIYSTVAQGGSTFAWSISSNGSISGSSTGSSVNVTAGTLGSYTLTVTVNTGCRTYTCTKTALVCGSLLTKSSLCRFDVDASRAGDQFRLIFTPDQASSAWKLNASNPGQFFYNVLVGGTPGDPGTVTLTLPKPFVTQGANPVHVFDGLSISSGCITPGNPIASSATPATVDLSTYAAGTTNVVVDFIFPSTGMAYINIHLDYGWKHYLSGCTPDNKTNQNATCTVPVSETINNPKTPPYAFSFTGPSSQSGSSTAENQNVFKNDPGIAGLVTCASTQDPMVNVKVEIFDDKKKLQATVYTDADGWYQWAFKYTGKAATFVVKLPAYGMQQSVIMKSNRYVVVNFAVPSGCGSSPAGSMVPITEGMQVTREMIPTDFALYQNYPDPFNPTTNIRFDIPTLSVVTLKVYNVLGQVVATLVDGEYREAGRYEVRFDASRLGSGVYFYRITTGEFADVRKMLLLK